MSLLNQEATESQYFSKQNESTALKDNTVVDKISRFLQARQIQISDFWKSDHNCASALDLVRFCRNSGLQLLQYDVINLKSEIFANKEMISVEKFAELVPFWDSIGKQTISDFLRKRSDILLDKIQSKQRKRPLSSFPLRKMSSDHSNKTLTRQASAQRFRKETVNTNTALTKNNSFDYLKKYKEKQIQREKELNDNIEKNKIDEQYGMLLKMSQLNTINKQRESKITYRAYKSAQGIVKVRVFNLNKFEKEISLNQFDTIYKNFKKTTKQNKDWTFVPQSQQRSSVDQLQSLKSRNIKKSQRQQQLKNLLVNTVNLTNLLKEQIKIFKMKGIYGCQKL